MARADPRTVFDHAEAFARAADRLRPDAPGVDAAPYLVVAALACELSLKCLLLLVKQRYPRVHSLHALWGDLPEDEQRRVLRLHRRVYLDHRPDASPDAADGRFEAILAGARDAMQLARYRFEEDDEVPRDGGMRDGGTRDAGVPDPTPIRHALRGRILQLEPAWGGGAR